MSNDGQPLALRLAAWHADMRMCAGNATQHLHHQTAVELRRLHAVETAVRSLVVAHEGDIPPIDTEDAVAAVVQQRDSLIDRLREIERADLQIERQRTQEARAMARSETERATDLARQLQDARDAWEAEHELMEGFQKGELEAEAERDALRAEVERLGLAIHDAISETITACKYATGQHHQIEQFVNATQIAEDCMKKKEGGAA